MILHRYPLSLSLFCRDLRAPWILAFLTWLIALCYSTVSQLIWDMRRYNVYKWGLCVPLTCVVKFPQVPLPCFWGECIIDVSEGLPESIIMMIRLNCSGHLRKSVWDVSGKLNWHWLRLWFILYSQDNERNQATDWVQIWNRSSTKVTEQIPASSGWKPQLAELRWASIAHGWEVTMAHSEIGINAGHLSL
jgi:hypothetical protein